MRLSPFELGSAALLAAAIGASPAGLAAQERPIVSSDVADARGEATLVLEFSDGGSLVVTFEDG